MTAGFRVSGSGNKTATDTDRTGDLKAAPVVPVPVVVTRNPRPDTRPFLPRPIHEVPLH